MFKGFKEFALRGNVIDMAVGIIIGGGFGKIVSSFVTDVLMPPIGLMLGNVDFSRLSITLREATVTTEEVTIKYGAFMNTVIDFVIIAFAIYMAIKWMNSLRKQKEKKEEPAPAPSKEIELLTEIRDLLKKN